MQLQRFTACAESCFVGDTWDLERLIESFQVTAAHPGKERIVRGDSILVRLQTPSHVAALVCETHHDAWVITDGTSEIACSKCDAIPGHNHAAILSNLAM